ncbi:hypothetical protein CPBF1521_18280 [Xanthomonas arboricola pv. juglandis]|nr:hypothetical protein CPBF1521_18280 [Xanthomonas arboricola pv. juglandis]SYZ59783.1 hypothetical protein CPBF427_19100 [Xanthomonas arboricola pv. juglandis]
MACFRCEEKAFAWRRRCRRDKGRGACALLRRDALCEADNRHLVFWVMPLGSGCRRCCRCHAKRFASNTGDSASSPNHKKAPQCGNAVHLRAPRTTSILPFEMFGKATGPPRTCRSKGREEPTHGISNPDCGLSAAVSAHAGTIPWLCSRASLIRLCAATFRPITTWARARPIVRRHLPPCWASRANGCSPNARSLAMRWFRRCWARLSGLSVCPLCWMSAR